MEEKPLGCEITAMPEGVSVSELRWKHEGHYLTIEGFPLGTTCYYVLAVVDGRRRTICASTPAGVYRKLIEYLADWRAYRERRGYLELPLPGE